MSRLWETLRQFVGVSPQKQEPMKEPQEVVRGSMVEQYNQTEPADAYEKWKANHIERGIFDHRAAEESLHRLENDLSQMKEESDIQLESTRHYVMPDPEDAASVYDTCESLGPWKTLNATDKLTALSELNWEGVTHEHRLQIIQREVDLSQVLQQDQQQYLNAILKSDPYEDIKRQVESIEPSPDHDIER